MISSSEINYIKREVIKMDIKPPEIKPVISMMLIARALVFDMSFDFVEEDLNSLRYFLDEVKFVNSKDVEIESWPSAFYWNKIITILTDRNLNLSPQQLAHVFAHELGHALCHLASRLDSRDVVGTDNMMDYDPKTLSYSNRSFMENIVERISAMVVFSSILSMDNIYISNNYSGYHALGNSLEMAAAMFGMSEYEFLRAGLKSKNVQKREISNVTGFEYDVIDRAYSGFEQSYNILHNALFPSMDEQPKSRIEITNDIITGLVGMMNSGQQFLQKEMINTDFIKNPKQLERISFRHNQFRVAFEAVLNNLVASYELTPELRKELFVGAVKKYEETSESIHYTQQFLRCRKQIEDLVGKDRYKQILTWLSVGDVLEAVHIMSFCDKEIEYGKMDFDNNYEESKELMLKSIAKYGIKPMNEHYTTFYDEEIIGEYKNRNKVPSLPLRYRIAGAIANMKLYNIFKKATPELQNKGGISNSALFKLLVNRKPQFPELKEPENPNKTISLGKMIRYSKMNDSQVEAYIRERLDQIKYQTPELKEAAFQSYIDRVKKGMHNNPYERSNSKMIEIDAELTELLDKVKEIRIVNDSTRVPVDSERITYCEKGVLTIRQDQAIKSNDPEKVYLDFAASIYSTIFGAYDDYRSGSFDNAQVMYGYHNFLQSLYGKEMCATIQNKPIDGLSKLEEKMLFLLDPMMKVIVENCGKGKSALRIASNGQNVIEKYIAPPGSIDVDKYTNGIGLLYNTFGDGGLTEEEKSQRLIDGCDSFIYSLDGKLNSIVRDYCLGYINSLDSYYQMVADIMDGLQDLQNSYPGGPKFEKYLQNISNVFVEQAEGLLYLERILQNGTLIDGTHVWVDENDSNEYNYDEVDTRKEIFRDSIEDLKLNDEDASWRACLSALCRVRNINDIENPKKIAMELLEEKGIAPPTLKDFEERITKARSQRRDGEYVPLNQSVLNLINARTVNNERPLKAKKVNRDELMEIMAGDTRIVEEPKQDEVKINLFKSIVETPTTINLDGKGNPTHYNSKSYSRNTHNSDDGTTFKKNPEEYRGSE